MIFNYNAERNEYIFYAERRDFITHSLLILLALLTNYFLLKHFQIKIKVELRQTRMNNILRKLYFKNNYTEFLHNNNFK